MWVTIETGLLIHDAGRFDLRLPQRLALLGVILMLVACQKSESDSTGGGGADTSNLSAMTVEPRATPSMAPRKGSTIRPTKDPSKATQPARSTKPSPIPKNEAPPTPFKICSPLADTPLDDLSQIIADPYRPPPPGSELRHHGVDFAYFHRFNRAAIEDRRSIANLIESLALRKLDEESLADDFEMQEIFSNAQLLKKLEKGHSDATMKKGRMLG